MKIATIARSHEHSPNMADNDAAILECVSDELKAMGAEVFSINHRCSIPDDTDAVCHMSRDTEVLSILRDAEKRGIRVVNSPDSVENCSRSRIMGILENNGTPQPAFRIIESIQELEGLPYPAWLKRGEGWSCHKDDICYANDRREAEKAYMRMQERGIATIIHTRHCEGDIIKFYGVEERYFTYCYPIADKTKFGLEKINGMQRHYPFNEEKMRGIVFDAAKAVGLKIYGGDCIVDSFGNIVIIDLNDFPSFSTVKEKAAIEIAHCIIKTK